MRRTALFVVSTAHLPKSERDAIDQRIALAPRNEGGRIIVEHPELVIESYLYGFFFHTGIVACEGDIPPDIAPEFWRLLVHADERGASWLLFDRDEPVSANWPIFADDEAMPDPSVIIP